MARVFRWFVGNWNGRVRCTFKDTNINNQSVVLVTASEGEGADNSNAPQRFVGDANITVHNIAPFGFSNPYGGGRAGGGGVEFVITIDWHEPLPIWADIVVLDEIPQGFSRSD